MEKNLERFVKAQEHSYENALREIRAGRKTGHWMWYIFPQAKGLGFSDMAAYYGIDSLEEARAYLAHPLLGARLLEICQALMDQKGRDAEAIFGYPDVLKLRSCMTLFALVSGEESIFQQVLDAFYHGEKDRRTMALMGD